MTDKEKLDAIRAEIHRLVDVRGYDRGMANDLFAFIDSLPNEPVSNDLEEAVDKHLVEKGYLLTTNNGEHLAEVEAKGLFKAGAQWQKDHTCFAGRTKTIEEIKEALLSEVLPCFMHGGEADEVVAKLDEVLNQK